MKHQPVVLVTGTSSGIGRDAVRELRERGCHVIATARNLDSIRDLQGDNVEVLRLDVTDDNSMQRAVNEVVAEHGRIDVLINNAGFGVMAPMEEMPMDQLRHMFEVNVFGLQRLTQLVLPHMRTQERVKGYGRGRIINVSSAAGFISLPAFGGYNATKFAVRGMSWAMRPELRPFGIHVCLIEPGNIRTEFGKRARQEGDQTGIDRRNSPYAAIHRFLDMIRYNQKGRSVRIISRAIRHASLARRPRFHYLTPSDAKAGWFAATFLPDTLLSRMLEWYFWRGRKPKD